MFRLCSSSFSITLSSDGLAGPGDVSSHPISISDVSTQSGDRDQELSDDEAPQSVHADLVTPTSPPAPARMQQFIQTCSPATATITLLAASSTSISPNRVRSYCTPGTVDGGLLFQVSPDNTGFLLWAGDTDVPVMPVGLPGTSETVVACPPPLGDPVAFDISSSIPESEAPGMSFPLVPLPSGIMLMPVSCSAQTVLAPGFPLTHNITREGPFDAYCSPMDTGDYPVVSAGLPDCPYWFTSYAAQPVADTDPAFGIHLHNPRF